MPQHLYVQKRAVLTMAAEAIAGILIVLFILFIIALVIASTAFWIWMIVDVAQRNFEKENDKIIWLLIILLVGFIGAVVYYFVVKRGGQNGKK